MYFPFIRGKQFDLIALRETDISLYRSERLLPIIEPVSVNKQVIASYKDFVKKSIPFILISNPVGPLESSVRSELIRGILSTYPKYIIGYQITQRTTSSQINAFVEMYKDNPICFVHYNTPAPTHQSAIVNQVNEAMNVIYNIFFSERISTQYRESIDSRTPRIILKDGFNKAVRNANYLASEDEYYSDVHNTCSKEGYAGFGDFHIMGEKYDVSGFAPHAVALHLTYKHAHDLRIRHFVSDDTEGTRNVEGKFMQALEKLVAFTSAKASFYHTAGSDEYLNLYEQKHYPGLGIAKKISIKHHIELSANL